MLDLANGYVITAADFYFTPSPPPPPSLPLSATIIGSEQPDTLTGTATMELIQGLGGDDTTSGGDTDDKLEGGDGDDALTGGRRQRHPHRRAGADRFVATAGSGDDVVTDFTVGSDLIDVAAFGGYQSIVQDGADTLVTVASGVTLRLTGVTATAVTEASFLGLPPPPPPLPPPAS